MAPEQQRVFLSYSRTDANLASDTARGLRKADVWLDYRDLKPGDRWQEQLLAQVEAADALLLLVSPRSLASGHVRQEWQRAHSLGIRVVLAIAEPTPLPEALETREWVDLRWRYKWSVRKLSRLLNRDPSPPSKPPPTSGNRAGFALWRAAALACLAALASLAAAWTIIVPLFLVPLPKRILERDFNHRAVRAALVSLPLTAGLPTVAFADPDQELVTVTDFAAMAVLGAAIFGGWGTLLALSSPDARRWMRPRATAELRPSRWRGARPPKSAGTTTFRLDAAPQDRTGAETLLKALRNEGHIEVADRPNVVIHLVSSFHDTVEIHEDLTTIPVLLADPDDELPPRLKQTQWIDMRSGLNKWRCKTFARLLADRQALMRWLGSATVGGRAVQPVGVRALKPVLWAVGLSIGAKLSIGLAAEFTSGMAARPEILGWAIPGAVGTLLSVVVLRAIDQRSRWFRRRYLAGLLLSCLLVGGFDGPPDSHQVVVIALGVCSLFIVLVMMALGGVWFVFRRDIRLWRGAS